MYITNTIAAIINMIGDSNVPMIKIAGNMYNIAYKHTSTIVMLISNSMTVLLVINLSS